MDHFFCKCCKFSYNFLEIVRGDHLFQILQIIVPKIVVVVLNIFYTCKFLLSTNCLQIVVPNHFLVIWSFPSHCACNFWKLLFKKVFLNGSCKITFFSLNISLIGRIHVRGIHLGNRLVGFYQLTVQKKMSFSTLYVNCCCQVKNSIFLARMITFFLFTRSQYMPIL